MIGALALCTMALSTNVARADNEFERLWGDVWGHKSKPAAPPAPAPAPAPAAAPAPTPAQPKPAGNSAPVVPPATQPLPAPNPVPAKTAAPAPVPAPSPAAPTVPVVLPKVQTVSDSMTLTGNAEAVTQVKLVARVPGYLETIHFQDGQIVKKDDLLFTVQQDQYQDQLKQAEAQLEAAKVARDHAHLEVARFTALLKKSATSQVEVDHWVYEEKTALANIKAAESQVALAKLNLSYTQVQAPFDGQMGRHLIDPGNMVGGDGPQATLAQISQLDPIYVVVNISSQQALQIRQNLDQRRLTLEDLHKVPIEAALSDESGFPHHGLLQYVDPQVDPQTGTLYVRGILGNPDRTLLPGMFVNVRLPMGKVTKSALLIPQQALQEDQGGRYLFTIDDDDTVQKRYVQLGEISGNMQVATSGVGRSDRIVIGELWRITPGMKVTPKLSDSAADQ
ncbi:MexE family multidrug efflux RND transporter periplasmic adaptor subunit [Labrys miyagiensis]|uniref:MexE family multidrug efflux RND transporter periplasmic adaptor subunit n=1 Tax=Labrys miyagiensis TaxID=346912 RepID=A0ABQ6CLF0_9HYPH|nr:efflux RND transporter periplasmic adaptor subunit [Labrys miyagiensis]GLS21121.1 MexE family multidrug efflux RND transporter periplasmic adaptor subunit [Labrys miyagiensis]